MKALMYIIVGFIGLVFLAAVAAVYVAFFSNIPFDFAKEALEKKGVRVHSTRGNLFSGFGFSDVK